MDEIDGFSHILGILGWLSVPHPDWNIFPDNTGPENSLTVWEDQPNPEEIFEDYGFAYYFMLYMQSRGYDQAFFTAWHHNGLNSIAGLNATLASVGSTDTFDSLLKDIAVSLLTDAYIDAGAPVTWRRYGGRPAEHRNQCHGLLQRSRGRERDPGRAAVWLGLHRARPRGRPDNPGL